LTHTQPLSKCKSKMASQGLCRDRILH